MKTTLQLFCIVLAFLSVTISPIARAVDPPPDGGYPNANTAEGEGALFNLTTGTDNEASDFFALVNNTTGDFNTASGSAALQDNTDGDFNTANGHNALSS